jgi:diguanylate cyclase (GGDEF)-like protein
MSLFDKNKLKALTEQHPPAADRPCVMLVDDEDANLRIMSAALGEKYRILRAGTGDEAWQVLQELQSRTAVACIISDQRMPGLSGVELCERACQAGLTAVRMIVTGYVDIDAIVDSINKAEIYKFIVKPFDTSDFRLTVQRAVEAFEMRAELDAYVKELEQKVDARTAELQQAVRTLEAMSLTDALTGVANRRRFDLALDEEWRRSERLGTDLAALFIDIDFFKGLNDTLGHAQGDICLAQVAEALREALPRTGDLLARYGGEEFAAIVVGSSFENVVAIAERMRQGVKAMALSNPKGLGSIVTISIGVASRHGRVSADEMMTAADAALYQAKKSGRDRVLGVPVTPTEI